jgi:hypothetical protein
LLDVEKYTIQYIFAVSCVIQHMLELGDMCDVAEGAHPAD